MLSRIIGILQSLFVDILTIVKEIISIINKCVEINALILFLLHFPSLYFRLISKVTCHLTNYLVASYKFPSISYQEVPRFFHVYFFLGVKGTVPP